MFLPFAVAILVVTGFQSPAPDRQRAEQLARAGHTSEAMKLYTQMAAADPADLDAQMWVARLALRLGQTDEAEAGFRAVLKQHPSEIDARIGLSGALLRKGSWREALSLLEEVEPNAGSNADLLAALARAYRRAGEDGRALEYYLRARALAPDDPDIRLGFESAVRVYGHAVEMGGYTQGGAAGTEASSGWLNAHVRLLPRLHLQGSGRFKQGADFSDVLAGAGVRWRLKPATTTIFRASGGAGNTALPTKDLSADVVHYVGAFEFAGGVRALAFAHADIVAVSPAFAWDEGRWRTEARYSFSHTAFKASDETSGDHSILVRETWSRWPRAALQGQYSHGIESFEDLTEDRLGSLATTTVAGSLRIDLRWLTRVSTSWEHEWRTNDSQVDRFTVSWVRFFQ